MANVTATDFLTLAERFTSPEDPAIDTLRQRMQDTIQSITSRTITAQDYAVLNDIAAACSHILGPKEPGKSRRLANWTRGDFWAIEAEAVANVPGNAASEEAQHCYRMARVSYELADFHRSKVPSTPTDIQERKVRLEARRLSKFPVQANTISSSLGDPPSAAPVQQQQQEKEQAKVDGTEAASQDQGNGMELSETTIGTEAEEEPSADQDEDTEISHERETYYSLVYDCFIKAAGIDRIMQRKAISAWIQQNSVQEEVQAMDISKISGNVAHVLSVKKEYYEVPEPATGKAKKGFWKLRDDADPVSARKK